MDKKENPKVGEILCHLSEDAFKPTEREKQLLQDLFDWQERSRKAHWILGQPVGQHYFGKPN